MVPMTNEEIDNTCIEVLSHIEVNHNYYYPYFHYLFHTGSRPVEVLRESYFVEIIGSSIVVQPDKKNNQRIIQDADINDVMYAYLTTEYSYLDVKSYRLLLSSFHSAAAPNTFMVEDKDIALYIFRFNKVKKMVAAGLTDEQIKSKMGWNNVLMVQHYNNQTVYAN